MRGNGRAVQVPGTLGLRLVDRSKRAAVHVGHETVVKDAGEVEHAAKRRQPEIVHGVDRGGDVRRAADVGVYDLNAQVGQCVGLQRAHKGSLEQPRHAPPA